MNLTWCWIWLAGACGHAPVGGGASGGGGNGKGSGGSNPNPGQCITPTPRVATSAIDCPRDVCGLNGIWMGGEVPFRTLHLKGAENEQHLAILGVQDPRGRPMTIDLAERSDKLVGQLASSTAPATLDNMSGATLLLGPSGGSPTYKLTITSVTTEPFWAQCDAGRCTPASPDSIQYHFTATRIADSCGIAVCDPSLSDHPGSGIGGVAAIFRGEYYNDATFSVGLSPPGEPVNNNKHFFNIVCRDTDIYKLYMMRHTFASAASADTVPTLNQRTALLRGLSATYCGGFHFTRNGVPIELKFNPAHSPYVLTPESGYPFGTGALDALWSPTGDAPAMCIGTPRVTPLGEVQARCGAPLTPTTCGDPSRVDYYLLSASAGR